MATPSVTPSDHYYVVYTNAAGGIMSREEASHAHLVVKKPNPFKPFDRGMEQTYDFKRARGAEPWKLLDEAVELFETGFQRGATEKMREIRSALMMEDHE